MGTRHHKQLTGLVVVCGVTVIVCFAVMLGFTSKPPPLPNPNGYDGLVKAAREASGDVGNFRELDQTSLSNLVSENTDALGILRVSLTQPCRAPVDSALANMSGLMTELADMKHLAQLLAAEGRLYEMDNRWCQAANSYTDAMQLGNEMSRGGLLITRLVGIACEAIGYHALAGVVPKLNCEETHAILERLTAIDARRVSWTEVMQAERRCARFHMKQNPNPVIWVVGWWNTRRSVEKAELRNELATAHERLLMTELALRCFRMETGNRPAKLDQLVTKYLPKVPQDSFGSGTFIYRPQEGTNWVLYSVGPDGVDDGGKPAGRSQPVKGDILVDSPW